MALEELLTNLRMYSETIPSLEYIPEFKDFLKIMQQGLVKMNAPIDVKPINKKKIVRIAVGKNAVPAQKKKDPRAKSRR